MAEGDDGGDGDDEAEHSALQVLCG
jgi:hypothetical protein